MPAVVRAEVDPASSIDDDMDFETFPDRIERCFANAIVLSQTPDPDTIDAFAAYVFLEVGSAECRIAIPIRIVSLADDFDI